MSQMMSAADAKRMMAQASSKMMSPKDKAAMKKKRRQMKRYDHPDSREMMKGAK